MADIPADTLFNVFLCLKRTELAQVSAVCQAWRKVAHNPHFLWPIVLKYKLGTNSQYDYYGAHDKLPVENDVVKLEGLMSYDSSWNGSFVKVIHSGGKTKDLKPFDWSEDYQANSQEIMALYKLAVDSPMHYKFEIVPIKKPFQIEYTRTGKRRTFAMEICWHIFFRLSITTFERHFSKKPVVHDYPGSEYIFQGVAEEHAHLISKWCTTHEFKQAKIPVKTFVPQKQPSGFSSHIKLKKYQLNAISWMKSIEEDADIGFDCSELVGWKAAGTKVLFDLVGSNFVVGNEVEAYVKHVTAKGGVLADEMGLGKTLEMVGLIMANPGNPMDVSRIDDKLDEEESDTEVQTTNIKDLISDSEGEEPPAKKQKASAKKAEQGDKDKKPAKKDADKSEESESKDTEEEEADKVAVATAANTLPEHLLFKTQASIVICPNHLVQQWQSEIAKHTSPPLCVIILTTKNDLTSTTYNDIVEADIVIVSVSLLKNPNYFNIGRGGTLSMSRGAEEKRMASWVPTQLRRIRESPDGGLSKKSPVLEHFIFRRMIVDEGHEILGDPFYQFTFSHYRAAYYWYMSGTPFPNDSIGLTSSIFDIPATVEDVVLLDFTDVEQAYYNEATTDAAKRELCCWLQLNSQVQSIAGSNDKSLTKLRADMLDHKKRRIKSSVSNIDGYKEELKQLYKMNDTQTRKSNILRVEERIKEEKAIIKTLVRELVKFESTHAYNGPDMSSTANISSSSEPPKKEDEKAKKGEEKEDKKEKIEEGNENDKAEEEIKNDTEDTEMLDVEDLNALTVPKLKAKLKELGIELPKKSIRKAELIALFPQKAPVKAKSKGAKKEKDKPEEKPEPPAKAKGKGKGKAKVEEPEQEDKPSTKRKRDEEEPEKEEDDNPPQSLRRSESLLKAKQSDHLNLRFLVEQLGTKLGNFVHYLKKLWEENPKHRVIVFSQFNTLLAQIGNVLLSNGIESAFVQGNVLRRNKALSAFKSEDSSVRVILLSLENAASGTNLVEASHIILMDPVTGTRKEAQAIESQAIGRAHRQGQVNQVTIVRFLIRGAIEHDMYIKNYLEDVDEAEKTEKLNASLDDGTEESSTPLSTPTKQTHSSTPKLVRTSTIGTLLANNKHLRKDSGIMELLENDDIM